MCLEPYIVRVYVVRWKERERYVICGDMFQVFTTFFHPIVGDGFVLRNHGYDLEDIRNCPS